MRNIIPFIILAAFGALLFKSINSIFSLQHDAYYSQCEKVCTPNKAMIKQHFPFDPDCFCLQNNKWSIQHE